MRGRGIFYDGISSEPQQVEIRLEENGTSLFFDTLQRKNIAWNLKDLMVDDLAAAIDIRLAGQPLQSLKTDDDQFIRHLKRVRRKLGYGSRVGDLMGLKYSALGTVILVICLLMAAVYFFLLPEIAERAANLIPVDVENKLGDSYFTDYMASANIDSVKTRAVNDFAECLKLNNIKPIHFTVVKSEEVNAFALPNGHIIIFTGILDLMRDHDELAGLMGHEVAHVNNRHSLKQMCRELTGSLFIAALLGDGDGVSGVVGNNINTLQSLTYSRHFEREADEQGLQMLIRNKIDPKGMADMLALLQSKENDQVIPEFLSSHPVTSARVEFVNEIIAQNAKAEVVDDPRLRTLFLQIKK